MFVVKNLKAKVDDTQILKGIDLEIKKGETHAIMGPNGSGKSTLANVIAGKDEYEVTEGSMTFNGEDLLELGVDERAVKGIFMAFQYPVELPGVTTSNFLKTIVNSKRKALGEEELPAVEMLKYLREKLDLFEIDHAFLKRALNEGFSGGERKRKEMLQMAVLNPSFVIMDETDSGLDIDALKTVAKGVNTMRDENRSFLIITHYQRLLNYIQPDVVHIMADGKIIRSGDKSLALELEEKGYHVLKEEVMVK